MAAVAALLPTTAGHAATHIPYSPGESVAYQVNAAHDGHLTTGAPALPLQKRWSRDLGGLVSYPIVAAGKVFVTATGAGGGYGTYLHAFDATTGATAWGPIPLGGLYFWSGLAYGGGRLYAVNYDGVLRAFDPATGAQKWIRQLPGQYAFSSEPTYADGIVYVGGAGSGGTLYAVSAVTGKVLWTRPVVNGDHSSPAVSEEGVFVSYACPNAFAFEPVDGEPLWTYSNGCSGGGGRTPVVADGLVWVRDNAAGLALDARTGQLAQVHSSVTTPAFDGARGYFREGGSLVAREPRTQFPLWTFVGDGQLSSPPIVVGNHVYVGSVSGMLYAVDAVTGVSSWSANVGAPIKHPDEHNVSGPVTGLGAGHGLIAVPASNLLVAYGSATPQTPPPQQVSLAWGWNAIGQLGDSSTVDRHAPATVTGGTNYRSVSGGAYHSLAVRPDGSAWGWGWNGVGQLGNGTLAEAHRPSRVLGLSGVTAVSAGFYHSLALRSDGTVWAWGWNVLGQLGDGTTIDRQQPVRVPLLDNVVAISAGAFHSVALRADGTVWSWGWNGVGQLGDRTLVDRHLPVRVSGLTGVTALDAGAHHNLALRADGSVAAWGWNAVGQLGNGTATDSPVPVTVARSPGFEGATAVSAGMYHSTAVSERATVWAWGWNGLGTLGDGTTADRARPVRVAGLTGIVAVDAGGLHNVAIEDDGATFAWGWNSYGQVGDGTTVDRHQPVRVPGVHRASVGGAGVVHTVVA
jgi:alpha-tubulin suppressor-like RCC1 family protein/outer membrane protein assembly factor BamB